jgi:ribosomal protein S12 methylthiotransferase accessory factor
MLSAQDFERLCDANRRELDDSEGACQFETLPDMSRPSLAEDLRLVLEFLANVGIRDAFVVDLTRPEVDIPVVRALVPTLEFEMPGNWMGPRLLEHRRTKPPIEAAVG